MKSAKIKKMSKEMGISEEKIRQALEAPQKESAEKSPHINRVLAKYYFLAASNGSIEETMYLLEWIRLTSTVKEAKDAYDHTLTGSDAKAVAIRKIATFYE